MKKYFLIFISVIVAIAFSGCSSNKTVSKQQVPVTEEPEQISEPDEKEEPEPEEEKIDLTGKALSPLTGLYEDEKIILTRPVTVMINNHHKALPQSGIATADIYYEVLAEGEITRIAAVFQNLSAEKIGPVRSARDYFTYFALDNNAVFVHHGGSPTGYSAIKKRGIDDIDGMTADNAFWRDKNRANKPGMYEHSSYTSGERIIKYCDEHNIFMELDTDYKPMFKFNQEDTEIIGESAVKIDIPFSYYQLSQFKYDDVKKVYIRFQNDEPHIDDLTDEALEVKNVIVQYANINIIAGDEAGRRNVDLVGSGNGIYFTNGKAEAIKWEKDTYKTPTRWYTENSNELKLNPGKTWICVFSNDESIVYE